MRDSLALPIVSTVNTNKTEPEQPTENHLQDIGIKSIWVVGILHNTSGGRLKKKLLKNQETTIHEIKTLMDKYISISIANSKYRVLLIFLRSI